MADVNNATTQTHRSRPPSVSSNSASLGASASASAELGASATVEPLYQVKLLQALRSGDPAAIHPFLAEIGKDKRKSVDGTGDVDTGAAALHLAIRCGSVQTISLLLSHRAISPNGIHPPGSGTTPLHLAASLGRLDVVNLLLEQEGVDDGLRDAQGRTCRDVARGREVVRAIDDSRAFLNASYRSLLHSYILSPLPSPPPQPLIHLLESPRAQFVDLSYLDNNSGTSLLHEAARRKDLRLIELAVRAGADVFVRNRKGKMAGEGAGRDERVRVFLRQFANYDKTLIPNPTPLTEPPVLKGYLNKYTNVAKGYNTRWFVLKNGVLSYYRHQDDETIASRGSISMKNAVLIVSEKTKLEVHSSPAPARLAHQGSSHTGSPGASGGGGGLGGLGSGIQKWYMKANHPVEAHRWAEAIGRSIEWFRLREQSGGAESDASSFDKRRRSGESDSSVKAPVAVGTVGGTPPVHAGGALPLPPSLATPSTSRTSASMWRRTLSRADRRREKEKEREKERGQDRERDQDSLVGSAHSHAHGRSYSQSQSLSVDASPHLGFSGRTDSIGARRGSYDAALFTGDEGFGGDEAEFDHEGDEDDEEEEEDSSTSSADLAGNGKGKKHAPPHPDFELQGNAASAQLELSVQLLANLMAGLGSAAQSQGQSPGQPQTASPHPHPHPQLQHTLEMHSALKDSLSTTQTLLSEYLQITKDRDVWWSKHLRKERKRQRVWEESLAVVVKEGEDLERELRRRSRRRGSRVFGPTGSAVGTVRGGGGGTGEGRDGRRGLMPSFSSTASTGHAHPHAYAQPSPVVEVQEPDTPGLVSGAPFASAVPPPQTPVAVPPSAPPKGSGTMDTTTSTLVGPPPSVTLGGGQDTIKARPPGLALPPYNGQALAGKKQDEDEDEEEEGDEEDEFFDAIESNNLPNLVVYEHLKSPSSTIASGGVPVVVSPATANASVKSPMSLSLASGVKELQDGDVDEVEREVEAHPGSLLGLTVAAALSSASPSSHTSGAASASSLSLPLKSSLQTSLPLTLTLKLPPTVSVPPYAGYTHLRARLSISNDQRPSTSLWSVLKHSIGKDLTKISFPVFFNEPTSMLQRMAEDMEFSECLDVAAHERDPLRRIAFVAAFAMSNYSSTIGRIAKPFNPMLSETFEYVRLDKQYRYVSEQVSHHPPISACWAESTSWHYYGEVDAQNKFMGKSFEIRPTGVAHADLLLPEDMAPHYPKAKGEASKGKVVEHYSWKKVTTSVSGFILGSPTIDHYGDMVVTNHRTGDQCILTFKPRGWRGKDAYEISGQVIDAQGDVAYEIAGRWNAQLVAKKVGMGKGQLHPDISVTGPNSPSVAPEYILLWRNSDKPAGSPFNLTPFAITLNDCPQDTLRPFICPTDCRLRPDQRAFELGKYELANDLKTQQEEKQRAIRRAREEGRMEPHRPRWFSAETDGDTGERVWSPVRTEDWRLEYWAERERVWREGGGRQWAGVDDIFVEEPEEVKTLRMK